MSASKRPGMGAIPYDGGTTFRVWAPNASAVSVTGTFTGWKEADDRQLSLENNGYWSGDIPDAAIGAEYKFVIQNRDTAQVLRKNDPYARALTNSVGNSVIAETFFSWQWPGYATPSWNELVIYELHVGSFNPTASNGRGNFDTVVDKLPYLQELGVNAIQLLPSDEFPGDISMGYNPSYIFAIETAYGGPNGLRKLVDAAHQYGIAVIYDVVYNHLGPMDLDLWQFDGWNEDGHGGIYFYNDWRRATPWGDTRPDYGRGDIRQYIRDNALRWLEERGCDGLRFDSTIYIRNVYGQNNNPAFDISDGWNLMQWINSEIRQRQPWKITIAEDLQENPWLTKPTDQGGAGFSTQWGDDFVNKLRYLMCAYSDGDRDMTVLRDVIAQRFNGDAFQRVAYTESHDEVARANNKMRVPEQISPGNADGYYAQKRSTLGAAIALTAPGIPMLFMGQEFLEWGSWSDAVLLDWSKATRFAGIRTLYQDLIHLRRNWFNTTRGLSGQNVNVHHVNNNDKVIAYHRWANGGPGDDVVVLVNFANRAYDSYNLGFPRGGSWRVRFNSDWRGYSAVFGDHSSFDVLARNDNAADGMPCGGNIGLGSYTCVILSQDT
jgi:1,4-alpha-glucan branching enzyme